jgi:hypothetical protein
MSRLEEWVNQEIASYEEFAGPLLPEERERFAEHLRGTLHGAQLRVADGAGELGDAMLAALKEHSDGLRDEALAAWFRRHWR